jgi:hypothetical protein
VDGVRFAWLDDAMRNLYTTDTYRISQISRYAWIFCFYCLNSWLGLAETIKVQSVSGKAEMVDQGGVMCQLVPNSTIVQGDKITTKGRLVLVFPNGTLVQLAPNSTLSIKVFQQVAREAKSKVVTESNGYSLTSLQLESGEVVVVTANLNPASSVSITGSNGAKYYLDAEGGCSLKRYGSSTEVFNLVGSGIFISSKDSKETYAVKSQQILVQTTGAKPRVVALKPAEFDQHWSGLSLAPALEQALESLMNRGAPLAADDVNAPSIEADVARVTRVLNNQIIQSNQQVDPSPTGG